MNKNVCGHEVYLGDVEEGKGNLIFVETFADMEFEKLLKLLAGNFNPRQIYASRVDTLNSNSYAVKIEGIPILSILKMDDWGTR